ncbi:MAG: hypothetical protein QGH15_00040 [Kiritimatiellia bacterium]|jgi:hypothetical protein|nr:hypothetical protein [Kiritimatiellia bacterium]
MMRIRSYLVIWAFLLLSIWSGAAEAKPAGTLKVNAWEFDRGNARVSENPGLYGDYRDKLPELMLTGGDNLPWVAEYDIDFPVDATYSLRVRYASAGVYPLDVLLDNKSVGKCCFKKTNNSPPYMDRHPNVHVGLPERTWHRHGAEWEDSCKIKVTSGKHTLKLTRNGQPANPIEIRLESPVAFPKGWKPAKREVVLSRVPVRYRNVFLPPDAVNTEALGLAIKDAGKTFGSQYSKGSQFLKQLAELEKKKLRASGGTTNEQQAVEIALKSLRREAMLDHPALQFDKLLFIKQEYASASTYTLQKIHYKPGSQARNLCLLSPVSADGKITHLVPELTSGVYGRFDLSFDATKIVFSYSADKHYRIYEIDIDPETGLRAGGNSFRQLTSGGDEEADTMRRYAGSHCGVGYHDLDPVYLPNGKIVFASTRSQRSVLCNPTTVTTLHVMDADGKNITCISQGQVNEISPCVMDDGRIIYMRWEYVDKGFGNVQSLWAVRPDGSGSDHVYKNDIICPGAMMHARSVPGSRQIVTTAAGHHGGNHGPIVLIDNRRHRRTADAMSNLTPEIGYPGLYPMRGSIGAFRDPYPFSEKLFLVSHRAGGKYSKGAGFGIYVLDAWGNRAELYRDPGLSCIEPVPLQPRREPTDIQPVIPTAAEKDSQLATMFLNDVYQGLPEIKRGRVKFIRVMEAMNLNWYDTWRAGVQGDGGGFQQISMVSNGGDVARKFVHGIATVHEDGSAFFTVPANKNLYFQALDENYMELHRMRTFINLLPGEKRSCVGCHEVRRKAPGLRDKALPQGLDKPARALYPQPGDTGPRAVHYPLDVQPILDKHCIVCHSGDEPKGGLVLTGEPQGKYFTRSYEELTYNAKLQKQALVSYLYTSNFGSASVPLEPPLSFGSHRSKMVERILKEPCKAKLNREEFIRIVTWIDANAPFYGTHDGKKNIKWKDDPDFRPMPRPLAANN